MWKAMQSKFGHRLETLNGYLEYFPRRESAEGTLLQNKPLSEDELLEIVDEAQPSGIQKLMIAREDSVTKYDSFDWYISALDGWYKANGLQIAISKLEMLSQKHQQHPVVPHSHSLTQIFPVHCQFQVSSLLINPLP
jgi:hypothetical protein